MKTEDEVRRLKKTVRLPSRDALHVALVSRAPPRYRCFTALAPLSLVFLFFFISFHFLGCICTNVIFTSNAPKLLHGQPKNPLMCLCARKLRCSKCRSVWRLLDQSRVAE